MKVCCECGAKIEKGESVTVLPDKTILCESCGEAILDRPAKAEREPTRDSSSGVGEW